MILFDFLVTLTLNIKDLDYLFNVSQYGTYTIKLNL